MKVVRNGLNSLPFPKLSGESWMFMKENTDRMSQWEKFYCYLQRGKFERLHICKDFALIFKLKSAIPILQYE